MLDKNETHLLCHAPSEITARHEIILFTNVVEDQTIQIHR